MQLGSILSANLGLCWTLFRDFLRLQSRSYLEVVLASIFLRFGRPLDPRKLSARLHENQIFDFLPVLSWDRFWARFWKPTWLQNRAQEAPKLNPKRSRIFKQLRSGFWVQLGPILATKKLLFGRVGHLMLWPQWATPEIAFRPLKFVRFSSDFGSIFNWLPVDVIVVIVQTGPPSLVAVWTGRLRLL